MEIWALSGFLGLPRDWDFLQWKNLVSIDWQEFALNDLANWGKSFNIWANQQNANPRILMGYSLGGRLALHALIDQPQQWQAAIIVSAHPGLSNLQERQLRIEKDLEWSKRFASENWITLMEAWSAQDVFAHDRWIFDRHESDYQRDKLVQALIHGSRGKQEDLSQRISTLPIPILWVTGSQDFHYNQIAHTLSFAHASSCWKQIEGAGHRVPWSQPQIFSQIVSEFLYKIKN